MTASEDNTVTLGRLPILFAGGGPISRHITGEIAAALPRSKQPAGLAFRFVERLKGSQNAVSLTPLRSAGVQLLKTNNCLTFEIEFRPMFPRWLPGVDLGVKTIDMNYLSLDALRAKNFLYKLFNWAAQIAQINLHQSFMHASAVTNGERTLAVLGKGGVGKTTAMLKLCLEGGWRYLSDDLAAIDENGVIYRAPARLQIYAYNTQNETALEQRLLNERNALDKLHWRVRRKMLGANKVRRRISAEELFGLQGVADKARLTDLIFLERRDAPGVEIDDIGHIQAAARMAPIVMDEIKTYRESYAVAEATAPGLLPDPETVQDATAAILKMAFSQASAYLIKAGPDTQPDDLARAMRGIAERPRSVIRAAS